MRRAMADMDRTALLEKARAAQQSGALDAARDTCLQLLALAPGDLPAMVLMAGIAADLGAVEEGLGWVARAIEANPRDAMAHFTAGRLHEAQNRLAEAEASYRAALACAPDLAKAHNNLGAVLQMQGRVPDALACYRRAIELEPLLPEANQNYASIARDPAARTRALEGLRMRLAANPRDAVTYDSMANVHRDLGQHAEALDCYAKAIEIDPDFAAAHFNRSQVLLQSGDYVRGWQEYEWRFKMPALAGPAQRFAEPVWHGRETAHTVLLHAEQGLGDTLQFVRYVSLVAPRCGAVILECQPALRPLLLVMRDAPQVVARGDPLPRFAMHAPLMSLPALLGTTLDTIPWGGPYLRPPAERIGKWREAFRKRRKAFNVALVWAGRPQHWDDLNRSISLSQLAPLAGVPGVAFFSLQVGGPAAAQAATPPPGMALYDPTAKFKDFADTAALASFMDLVISVDTSVAHLAGGMGMPTWVLVPYAADWRHHLRREDNPWYPTMRLFRQPRDGDWAGAIEPMAAELARLAASKVQETIS
jgi:tetratricopeptide (TPR) repeat protein